MSSELAANLFNALSDANRAASQHIAIGREQGEREAAAAKAALRTVIAAYDAAGAPPIPSAMLAAIEAARRVL